MSLTRRRAFLARICAGALAGALPGCFHADPAHPRPSHPKAARPAPAPGPDPEVEAVVLGTAQDGGVPHLGCNAVTCERARLDPGKRRLVACLGLVDRAARKRFLVEATPDLPLQVARLDSIAPPPPTAPAARANPVDGVLLTHAHIGHYTGLMYFGLEVAATRRLPLHGTERMLSFLRGAGPWSQLFRLGQVEGQPLRADASTQLTERLSVVPLVVPHRDEFSDTVAFRIVGPRQKLLFVPDIDRWDRWDRRIEAEVEGVDVALIDGTFYSGEELPGRDVRDVPHPLVTDSMQRLSSLARSRRIVFIHLNHTNPLLDAASDASKAVRAAGFEVAAEGMRFAL